MLWHNGMRTKLILKINAADLFVQPPTVNYVQISTTNTTGYAKVIRVSASDTWDC